jgi:hypothetical protein
MNRATVDAAVEPYEATSRLHVRQMNGGSRLILLKNSVWIADERMRVPLGRAARFERARNFEFSTASTQSSRSLFSQADVSDQAISTTLASPIAD